MPGTMPGAMTPQQSIDQILNNGHGRGHPGFDDDAYSGDVTPIILGDDDPLTSPFPAPDYTRRGFGHIYEVLDQINILDDAESDGKRHQAVPWHGEVLRAQPRQPLQPLRPHQPLSQSIPIPQPTRFDSMRAVAERQAMGQPGGTVAPSDPDDLRGMICQLRGFSTNYKGDISNDSNRSANIPEHENTSLWIVGLYAAMDTARLLSSIAHLGPTGKIWATVISNAQPEKGHAGSAAKIVFFDRVGAERLKQAIEEGRLNGIVGRAVRVTFNRIRSAPQTPTESSRVLLIRGPGQLVNRTFLDQLFTSRFVYQTEAVNVLEQTMLHTSIEWRFGSFRSQAQSAGMLLSREYGNVINWVYGRDPCAIA